LGGAAPPGAGRVLRAAVLAWGGGFEGAARGALRDDGRRRCGPRRGVGHDGSFRVAWARPRRYAMRAVPVTRHVTAMAESQRVTAAAVVTLRTRSGWGGWRGRCGG